jgi:hypothetical protein
MNANNPLKQYFRQPAIYIRLPSGGQFYPPGTLEMTASGEFPVYPMTAIDEITYRTPDALFNGEAVVTVIQSCVPSIKNAWALPSIDLDTILTAIRIASYGHNMEFETRCPGCNHEEGRTLDLRTVMDMLKSPDYTKSVTQGDIEIYFKPMTYKNLTDNNKAQYEEQRILNQLTPAGDTPEDIERARNIGYTEVLKKITQITVGALAQSIAIIKTPTAQVSEPEYISEFLSNCDRSLFNQIRDYIIETKTVAELQPLTIKCSECQFEYKQAVTLNMTDFFAGAS